MMTRIATVMIVLMLVAATALASEGLIPLTPGVEVEVEERTMLRGSFDLVLYRPPDAEPLRLSILARRVGGYEHLVRAWPVAIGEAAAVEAAPGERVELILADSPPGPVTVRLDTGQNAAELECSGPLVIPASQERRAAFISHVGRLFFYVPRDARGFIVGVRGQGHEENALLTVFNPAGEEMGSATTIGGTGAELRVEVPQEHAGAVWSLTAGPADTGVFEDVSIWLSQDVPPYVSLHPEALLVPFVEGMSQSPRYVDADADAPLRLRLTRPFEQGRLSATLLGPAGETLGSTVVDASEGEVEVAVPALTGEMTLVVELEAPPMPAAVATATVARRGTLLFTGYEPLLTTFGAEGPDGEESGVRVGLTLADAPRGLQFEARLTRTEPSRTPGGPEAEIVQSLLVSDWDGRPVDLIPEEAPGNGAWEWQVELREGSGVLLDWTRHSFVVWDGQFFTDRTELPAHPLIVDAAEGWVAFALEGADAVPYRYRPGREDLAREIEIIATPGEFQPVTVGALALEATELRVDPPDLRSAGGQSIPAEAWDVRWTRYWPQRTNWNAVTFTVIPEMLERRETMGLAALQPAQAWLTVRVPEDAAPGRYRGAVTISDDAGRTESIPITLDVQPFTLMEPSEYHWGLYTDSPRWKTMPEQQVRAELRDFVEHGITSAMMYPPAHSEFAMEGDQVAIDSSEFERFMRWALEEGLRPPTVMSMQALGGVVRRLVPEAEVRGEEFERVYKQIVRYFVDLGAREGWGEIFWHAVDEPNRRYPDKIEAAYQELGWFKDLGLMTFTTVNDPVVAQEHLDPVLDARCYYVSFVAGSAHLQEERARETAESGDHLWLYGTGCYTGMDGTTMPNRYLAGYILRKTEAEGIWCWTLQRAKGDIYNDFDAEGHRESKDACTTYPSEDGTEMVPTLQWEGHREGVDDFRYVYTLERLAAERGEQGEAALRELSRLLDEVPWGVRPGDFTAARADEIRVRIARLIRGLLEQ